MSLSLNGMLIPWKDDQLPVVIRTEDNALDLLPVFSSRELLQETMEHLGEEFTKLLEITDGESFVQLVSKYDDVKIIVDPRITADGVTYREVIFGRRGEVV